MLQTGKGNDDKKKKKKEKEKNKQRMIFNLVDNPRERHK